MTNEKVRTALFVNNVRQWKLAEKLGMSESALCRKLRNELPNEEQEKLVEIIKSVKE